jgi:hypothetical protein
VLGNLQAAGHMLPQAFTQLGQTLARSLDQYEVYEDDGCDPLESVTSATDHLSKAAALAEAMAEEFPVAQSAIIRQGYR